MQSSLFDLAPPDPRSHQPDAPIRQALNPQTRQSHPSTHQILTQNHGRVLRRIHFCPGDLRRLRRTRAGTSQELRGIPGPVPANRARNTCGAAPGSRGLGLPADCVVYDPFMPWALDVAKGFGLLGAAFFTQSCAVDNIYHHVYRGELELPLSGGEVVVPGLPAMRPDEMPSFIYDHGSCPGTFEMVLNQFRNVDKADWIFINTFDELEEEVINFKA
ncbi:UDP-glycosyltransferase 74F2 [Sesamum angolense]|uniref:UDP-glycosyltransferase 74F2 n=1 Tax=Sesamum angolense TaxID=2727404 RepID=A0AAE1VZW8_9LAMI|nr:UDP-glycosyltransferase 74F2 [Sesamum angolense]